MKKKLFATLVSVSLLSTMVLSGCGQNSTDEKGYEWSNQNCL